MSSVQGVPVSWADFEAVIDLGSVGPKVVLEDFTALSWKRTVERAQVRGKKGTIRGNTTGQPGYEASATLLEADVTKLEQALMVVDRSNISLVEFQITCIWTPPRARRNRKVEIFGCQILEDGFTNALGVDAASSEYKFMPTKILHYPDAKGPPNTLLDRTKSTL